MTIVLVLTPLLVMSPASAAPSQITLVINGQVVPTDVPPMLVNDRTLVPVRVVSEYLGAAVGWDQPTRTVTIVTGHSRMTLTIGQTLATIDGQPFILDSPPLLISDRTLVPIRFISEGLGGTCDWVHESRQVVIAYSKGQSVIETLAWAKTPEVARFVLVTNGPLPYRAVTLGRNEQYPDRIIIEADRAMVNVQPEVGIGVAGVRMARSFRTDVGGAPLARVVFDLDEPLRFRAWATWEPDAPAARDEVPVQLAPGQEAIIIDVQYRVLGVSYIPEPGAERLAIRLSGPADYQVWEATNPWRLVIDIRQTNIAGSLVHRSTPVGAYGITQARWSQFQVGPDIARVVLDANGAVPYTVIRDGDDILVYFGGTATVTGLGYDRTTSGGRLVVTADRPISATVTRSSNLDLLTVEIRGARLSPNLAGGGVLNLDDALVRSVTYTGETHTQKVVLTLAVTPTTGAGTPTPSANGFTLDILRSALAGRIIVIDPGHGGNDPGAIVNNGVREATLTHEISAVLVGKLRAAGATVYVTCAPNENPDKYERAAMANSMKAEAFVSVHLNANNRSAVCGSEVYYSDTHPDSRRLSQLILTRLVNHLGRPNGGVRFMPAFAVIREPVMPSCLVEGLYMTNPDDLALLMNPATREKIAQAIYEGLWDFFASR